MTERSVYREGIYERNMCVFEYWHDTYVYFDICTRRLFIMYLHLTRLYWDICKGHV